MDLDTRKIAFVQEFLKLQSDDVVSRFEKILKKEKKNTSENLYEPMSHEELNKRIDQSEADFRSNRLKVVPNFQLNTSNDIKNYLVGNTTFVIDPF